MRKDKRDGLQRLKELQEIGNDLWTQFASLQF